MKVYICTDHDGHSPIGVASVIVAADEAAARDLLASELFGRDLEPSKFTLQELDTTTPGAHILRDGEY